MNNNNNNFFIVNNDENDECNESDNCSIIHLDTSNFTLIDSQKTNEEIIPDDSYLLQPNNMLQTV